MIPDCTDELISTAKLLGKSVEMFMRIDLYATTRGAVFGEFTSQPMVVEDLQNGLMNGIYGKERKDASNFCVNN